MDAVTRLAASTWATKGSWTRFASGPSQRRSMRDDVGTGTSSRPVRLGSRPRGSEERPGDAAGSAHMAITGQNSRRGSRLPLSTAVVVRDSVGSCEPSSPWNLGCLLPKGWVP